jgi:hypothetical protein
MYHMQKILFAIKYPYMTTVPEKLSILHSTHILTGCFR